MYCFEITHRHDGTTQHACSDQAATDARTLARKMVEGGALDAPIEAGRTGRIDWTVPSLHRFAAVAMMEGDRGFSFKPYAPYPTRDLHPALDHAISVLRRDRKTAAEERAARVVAEKAEKALAVAS